MQHSYFPSPLIRSFAHSMPRISYCAIRDQAALREGLRQDATLFLLFPLLLVFPFRAPSFFPFDGHVWLIIGLGSVGLSDRHIILAEHTASHRTAIIEINADADVRGVISVEASSEISSF